MELLKNNPEWFFSSEGEKSFSQLNTLEDRAVFIYSYLKTVASRKLDENSFLFKVAFLFADAIYSSDVAYAKYPDIIDAQKNPFVKFLKTADYTLNDFVAYCILLAILHEKVDPYNDSEWIYDSNMLKQSRFVCFSQEYQDISDGFQMVSDKEFKLSDDVYINLLIKLANGDMQYAFDSSFGFGDPKAYKIDNKLKFIQTEIIWLFGAKLIKCKEMY